MAALRCRYSGNDWAFLTEVPDGTGAAKTRSADAMAMSLWPSRGLELHGIEVKANRADWLRELKDAAKAEALCSYCDRWWIAAGDPDIVREGELPKTWGLLVPRGKTLVQKVAAPELSPLPVDRCFLAGLLRRAMEQLVPKPEVDAAHREEVESAYNRGKASAEYEIKRAQDARAELESKVKTFEAASGLTISGWYSGNIGETVRLLRNFQPGCEIERTRHILSFMAGMTAQVEEFLKKYEVLEQFAKTRKEPPQ